VISPQVLQEFFVTVTRKLASPLPAEEALETIRGLGELPVVITDAALVFEAAALSSRHQISLWDALILEAAHAACCEVVLSEDLQDGWRVGEVEVRNPFLD
jgi:predicted nucleic acid-binding protein